MQCEPTSTQPTTSTGNRVEVGARFGRLVVTEVYSPRRCDQFRAKCRCDCGELLDTEPNFLRAGRHKSCGCYRRDRAGQLYRKHGLSKTPAYTMFYDARKRAIGLGLPFNIEPSDLAIPDTCPVLGITLVLKGTRDNRPSLDRVLPELGYVRGNVRVISFRANRIKSDATPSELRRILAYAEGSL